MGLGLISATFSSLRSLTISQFYNNLSNQLFSHILQSLQFLTDPVRPLSPLSTSNISIRTYDGRFYSYSPQSIVNLNFINIPPVLSILQLFTPTLEESDSPSISIFSRDDPPRLYDDSGSLQRIIISLTNQPDGDNEILQLINYKSQNVTVSYDTGTLILEGPATIQEFISLLTKVTYTNSKLSDIIMFSPDLTDRIISIQAVDTEGGISESSSLTISFLANCRNGPSLIKVSTMYSLLQLSLCEQLQADLEISGEQITSLSPLSRLRMIIGSLVLREIPQLTSLTGLENLEFFESISISRMPDLISTSELGQNVTSDKMITVRGISVNGNPNLLDLTGFVHVEVVNGPIVIAHNSRMSDLTGLNGIIESEEIYIISNNNLQDINGFSHLLSVVNSVYINLNSNLTQLTGFSSLMSVGDDLLIIGNSQLLSVDGLISLQSANSVILASNNQLCYIGNNILTASVFDTVGRERVIVTENQCLPRDCTSKPCLGGGICNDIVQGGFTCVCPNGLTGDRCQLENECITTSPCENNASCVDMESGYNCSCLEGYTGSQCQTDIDNCYSHPCMNDGICIDSLNSFSCDCPSSFTGYSCETEILYCPSNPCANNSTCFESDSSYTCLCAPGYTGTDCEVDIEECNYLPCVNGGSCVNIPGSFSCNCLYGYTGMLCEDDIDECSAQPCSYDSTCINTKGGFVCLCPPDVEGIFCQRSVHPCIFIPCKNGQCREFNSSFECQCNLGYTGNNCESRINHCQSQTCLNGGYCINRLDGYSCDCSTGYFGSNCEFLNQCYSNPCLFGGECLATEYTFTCQCPPGISGDRLVANEFSTILSETYFIVN